MKHITTLLITLLLTALSLVAGELKLEWNSPDDFRDADYYYNGGAKSKEIVLTNLERYFKKEAERRLSEGSVLTMKVTQLDLAGDFEPWNNRNFDDIRIIKSIYPAIIEFEYQYADAEGNVVAEGSERLKDDILPGNLSAQFTGRTESYPYIKTLVKDWMRKLAKS